DRQSSPAWSKCRPAYHRQKTRCVCLHSGSQMAARRFQLLPDGGPIRSSKSSRPPPLPGRLTTPSARQSLDCAAPISFHGGRSQCVGLRLAHALASVPSLQQARERKSIGALDLSRDTCDRLLRDRDLFSDLRGAVSSAQCLPVT